MCFPLQAGSTFLKTSVMLSRAFQNGQFRSLGESYYFPDNTRRKCSSQNGGLQCILAMETSACTRCLQTSSFANVLRSVAGTTISIKSVKKIKDKSRQGASKIRNSIAMAKIKSKSWMQNGCKREKLLWHEWEQHFYGEVKVQRKGKEGGTAENKCEAKETVQRHPTQNTEITTEKQIEGNGGKHREI